VPKLTKVKVSDQYTPGTNDECTQLTDVFKLLNQRATSSSLVPHSSLRLDSFFVPRRRRPPPLLPMPLPTPASAHPPRRRPHRQPAPSGAALRLHWHPRPTQPPHPPSRKLNAIDPLLLDAATTASQSGKGELTKIPQMA
jgi:hypothetical protein